jgi:hypothetical protein
MSVGGKLVWKMSSLSMDLDHGEVTPCQIKNHVQRKFATPILYAIDIFKNYDFFFSTYITIDNISCIFF